MSDCLFCKIIAGDIPCHKIYEDDRTVAFLDIFPVSEGHALVLPKVHAVHLLETSSEDALAMMATVKKITPAILQAVGGDGFNLGGNNGESASQEIPHTHLHIMPRKTGVPRSFEKTQGDQAGLAILAEKIRQTL
ncbi:MAG TPA: HIT family protein [Candidatus Paceibacterota bacterium]